jgi:hypothetical protein
MAGAAMSTEVSADTIKSFQSYQSNLKWAKENGRKLERYAGKYVAVANGRILDSAQSGAELETKYKDVPGVYVAVVVRRGLRWVL